MSADVAGYAVAAVAVMISGCATAWASVKAKRIVAEVQAKAEESKAEAKRNDADGEAYERAQRINEQIVDGLTRELTRLHNELLESRRQLDVEKATTTELRNHIRLLEDFVDRVSALLRANNIPVPTIGDQP